jgi:hypothetical protein
MLIASSSSIFLSSAQFLEAYNPEQDLSKKCKKRL